MKWIELVRVRSSEHVLRTALSALEEQVRALAVSVPEVQTFVLQHALYEGDLAVMLVWPSAGPKKTREGLLIAEQLQRLGMVDHAVWRPAAT